MSDQADDGRESFYIRREDGHEYGYSPVEKGHGPEERGYSRATPAAAMQTPRNPGPAGTADKPEPPDAE